MVRGLARMVSGVLQPFQSALAGTMGFPVVGTAVGAITGTLQGAAMVVGGAFETAVGALPWALKLLPFLSAAI